MHRLSMAARRKGAAALTWQWTASRMSWPDDAIRRDGQATSWSSSVSTFAGLAIVVLALQAWMGAFRVERGMYSDEAAHFMNGLLIRDYIYQAIGSNPVAFAEQYYLSYPKIAPLMWPPLFHAALGLSLLPGWPPAPVALLLVGLSATWVAWRLYCVVETFANQVVGFVAVALFLTTPLVMQISSVVMLDIVIAALAFEATYWLARFVRSASSRDAALYGVFTALACLTKGNGVSLVLLPVILIPITGRFNLLRRPGLYIAAAIVLVFGAPLLAVSAQFDASIGDFGPVTIADVINRFAFYGRELGRDIGPVSLGLAMIALAVVTARGRRRRDDTVPLTEAMAALVVAAILFHVLSPHRLSVDRYMTMAIAPIIALAIVGAFALAQSIRVDARRPGVASAIAIIVAIAALAGRATLHPREPLGYRQIVARLAASDLLAGRRMLVVSDEAGEGAAVTEVAALNLHPAPTVIRGSKLLAQDDWMGRHFQMSYASPTALMQDLEDLHVEYVLVDRSTYSPQVPYFGQVRQLTDAEHHRLKRVDIAAQQLSGPTRRLELYRVKVKSPGPPKTLQVGLTHTLGRTLRR
jgi:hypothetical protein